MTSPPKKSSRSFPLQVLDFLIHLRWHYQLGILSGGFLLGGFISPAMNAQDFLVQFANVHLLLFGGATAYNSYWDKDTGPIGGLKHPPGMQPWMWWASWLLQITGLFLAFGQGTLFVIIYLASMLFFWLYSTPVARWKGDPVKSLIAIGVSTGTNSFLMGYISAGNMAPGLNELGAAIGVALVILSLYPVSQIYQMEEDSTRGDRTFAVAFGRDAVIRFFAGAFLAGVCFIVASLLFIHPRVGILFGITGLATGGWIWKQLKSFSVSPGDYSRVMQIKYGTSLAFVLFLIIANVLKHTPLATLDGVEFFLK